ncbi:hypothetical protein ROHU_014674 [Labeo rohita]|uniref:Uncharacterized protein n=1 Tax=Labeo rohita TaxID=84645 RepID=A0A498LFW2_LABRO|nr:hypothetical protein ROHU_034073 [Labeo rohita]RXN34753.1 hypothetical protein ROHU_014674 [Labeo rohita]
MDGGVSALHGRLRRVCVPGNTCRCTDARDGGEYSGWSDEASDVERLPKSPLLGCDRKLITVIPAHTQFLSRSIPAAPPRDRGA